MKTCHLIIVGRVQGVGFRFFLLQLARKWGLNGWVRNRTDGSVGTLVSGEDALVDRFMSWVQERPAMAHVEAVHSEETLGCTSSRLC